MRSESVSRPDQSVAFEIGEYARRLAKADFEPVLQDERRSIAEAGNDLQHFAIQIIAHRQLVALSNLIEEIGFRLRAALRCSRVIR